MIRITGLQVANSDYVTNLCYT